MRKMTLNEKGFAGVELLSREQLKKVTGGNASLGFSCDWTCETSTQAIHLGVMDSVEANAACPFGELSGEDCSNFPGDPQ